MDETVAEPRPTPRRRGPAVLRPLEYLFGPWTRENAMVWLRLALVVLAIKWLFIDTYRVPTGSMEPTLHGDTNYVRDDRVVVNKLAYGIRLPMSSTLLSPTWEPKRWDIVVFRSTEPPPPHTGPIGRLVYRIWPTTLIKRVVGLPGERIHIEDGVIHADGRPLALPKNMPPVSYTSIAPDDSVSYVISKDKNGNVAMVTRGSRMRYGVWDEDEYSVVPKDGYLMLGDNSGDSADGRYFGWVPRERLIGRAYAIWWPLSRVRDLTGFSHTWWGLALLIGIPLFCVGVECMTHFVVRGWRVREDSLELGLRKRERLRVNCLATGLRLPLSRRRLTRGVELHPGELVVYLAPPGNEWAGTPLLGVLRACGDTYFIESAEGPEYPGSHQFGPVERNNIVGRAESVWWPVGRRRALRLVAGTSEEYNAKASYGKEE